MADDMANVEAAEDLKELPENPAERNADPQAARRDDRRGQQPERRGEQAEVEQQRQHDPSDLDRRTAKALGHEGRSDRGNEEQNAEDRDEGEPAQPLAQKVGALLERHSPDPVEGVLDRLSDAETRPQRA